MRSPRATVSLCAAAALLAAGLAAQPTLVRDSFFISPVYQPLLPGDRLWVGDPAVAALGPDTFAVSWVVGAWNDEELMGYSIVEGRLVDTSGEIGPSLAPVYDDSAMECPALAPTREGGFIRAAIEDCYRCETRVTAQRFGAGSVALEDPVVVYSTDWQDGLDGCPAVAAHPGGRYVLSWLEERGDTPILHFEVFLPSGKPVGPPASLGDQRSVECCNFWPKPPALGMDGAGRFVLVWWAAGGGLRGQRFGLRGAPLGKPFAVAKAAAGEPVLAMARDGGFVVAWTGTAPEGTPQPLLLRRFTAEGTPAGPAMEVDRGVSGTPLLAADRQGNFALAWQGNLQLFDRSLVPQGEKISAPADRLALSDDGLLLTVEGDGSRVRGRLWRARHEADLCGEACRSGRWSASPSCGPVTCLSWGIWTPSDGPRSAEKAKARRSNRGKRPNSKKVRPACQKKGVSGNYIDERPTTPLFNPDFRGDTSSSSRPSFFVLSPLQTGSSSSPRGHMVNTSTSFSTSACS